MIAFWIAAGLLAAAAAVAVLFIASRARSASNAAGEAAPDAALYARQLEEIEALHARGLLGEEERRAARAETGRRLLAAADRAPEAEAVRGGRTVLLATVAGAALLAAGLYLVVGSGGRADAPYAARLKGWKAADPATLPPQALAAVAKDVARRNPGQADAWRVLGRARLQAGETFEAVQALEQAARLGDTAEDYGVLGMALTVVTRGLAAWTAREPPDMPA